MKTLIRGEPPRQEVYPEDCWTKWTVDHLDWEIEINGWTLVEDWQPGN